MVCYLWRDKTVDYNRIKLINTGTFKPMKKLQPYLIEIYALRNFIGNKGGGYRSAAITDFKYKIDTTDSSINFVLVNMGWFRD